jgi:DMSO/TMAO reductase YedYZ heme-binding membrane subunit
MTQLTWAVARAGGLVSWALAAASVLWGLALSTRLLGRRPRPPWLYDLHRFLGGLTVVFIGVHVGAILLDRFVHFGLIQVLVPFTGTWHPTAVAWGIVAMDLAVAVEVTSLLRSRISTRVWRRVHLGSFAVFMLGTVHGLSAGTDALSGPTRWLMVGTSVMVVAMTAVRIASPRRTAPTLRRARVPARPDRSAIRAAAFPRDGRGKNQAMNQAEREDYEFSCGDCGSSWTDVTLRTDGTVVTRSFWKEGLPVTSPLFGKACRLCGGHVVNRRRLAA